MERNNQEYLLSEEPVVIKELGNGKPQIVFNVATHGNEPEPLHAVEELLGMLEDGDIRQGSVSFTLANPPALRQSQRFLTHDLNRIYPGNPYGVGEEVLAAQMLSLLGKPEYVVDLHTGPELPPVVILGRRDPHRLALAEATGIEPIVLFEASKPCAMVDYVQNGIGIELGKHDDMSSRRKGVEVMTTILKNLGFIAGEQVITSHQFYEVLRPLPFQDVAHLPFGKLRDFEVVETSIFPVEGDEPLYPFLCGTQGYTDNYCYLMRKVSREYLTHY